MEYRVGVRAMCPCIEGAAVANWTKSVDGQK